MEQCIHYIKTNDVPRFTESLEKLPNWTEERGNIPIQIYKTEPLSGNYLNMKCNLLQIAVALQNLNAIKLLIHESKIKRENLERFLFEKVAVQAAHLESDAKWIQGATVAHLAARFCPQVLGLLLDIQPGLVDNSENEAEFTPLHVAAASTAHKCSGVR